MASAPVEPRPHPQRRGDIPWAVRHRLRVERAFRQLASDPSDETTPSDNELCAWLAAAGHLKRNNLYGTCQLPPHIRACLLAQWQAERSRDAA